MTQINISIKAMQENVDPISIPYEPFNNSNKWYEEIIQYWGFKEDEIKMAIEDNIAYGDKYGSFNVVPNKVLISSKMNSLILNIITNDRNSGCFVITMQKNHTYTCLGMWKYFCIVESDSATYENKLEDNLYNIGDDYEPVE